MYWPKAVFDNNTGHVITSDSDSSGYSGLTVLDGAASVPYAPTQWEITASDGIDNPPIYGVVLDSTTKMDTISGGARIIRIKTVGPNRVYIDGVETDILERGKYAAAGSTGVAYNISTTNVMQFFTQLTSGINYQISWNGAGLFTEPTSTNLPSFIKNAGYNDPNNGEASLLYISTGQSYGESTNIVIDLTMGVTTSTTYFYAPTNASSTTVTIESTQDWTQGMKWLMSESENMLGNSGNPTAFLSYWSPALIKSSANGSIPHMILGSKGTFAHDTVNMLGVLTTFFQYATNGSVADAWVIHAASKFSNSLDRFKFSVLAHYDNKEDTLIQPTPDSADKTMWYEYWDTMAEETVYQISKLNEGQWKEADSQNVLLASLKPFAVNVPKIYQNNIKDAPTLLDMRQAELMCRKHLNDKYNIPLLSSQLQSIHSLKEGTFVFDKSISSYNESVKGYVFSYSAINSDLEMADYQVYVDAHRVEVLNIKDDDYTHGYALNSLK